MANIAERACILWERILEREDAGTEELIKINRRLGTIMSALDNLRTAVNNVHTTFEQGQVANEEAFAELASDIANIPSNADVQAEADRVAALATAIGAANVAFAQRIKDALPTASPTEPLPPVETPVEEEPVVTDPNM